MKKTEKLHKKKMSDRVLNKEEMEKDEEENGERSSNAMTPSTLGHFSHPPKPATTISDGKETEVIEDTRKAEDSVFVINRQAEHKEQKVRVVGLLSGVFVI